MERRDFLGLSLKTMASAGVGGAAFLCSEPPRVVREVQLPFLDGVRTVYLHATRGFGIKAAEAQYAVNYQVLAYQQWLAAQQAMAQWQAQQSAMAQQYAWYNQQRHAQWMNLMQRYSSDSYQRLGQPRVMQYVNSLYGYAQRELPNASNPARSIIDTVLYGLNRLGAPVGINQTIRAGVAVWDTLSELGKTAKTLQQVVAPQSSEGSLRIKYDGESLLDGIGYDTTTKALGISHDEVSLDDGTSGRLVKYFVPGSDGPKPRFTVI
jgi:hypothetical protein